jgi:uncharacterized OB-fold protein
MTDEEAAAALAPPSDALNDPFWQSLREGRLTFQRCSCGNAWLPSRHECPNCLKSDWKWETASGKAKLISWIVYHRAFHDAFAKRIPYTVAVVQLAEGPRMTSNIIGVADPEALKVDQPLRLVIEQDFGLALPRFTPA